MLYRLSMDESLSLACLLLLWVSRLVGKDGWVLLKTGWWRGHGFGRERSVWQIEFEMYHGY